jgi:hypothetical protein
MAKVGRAARPAAPEREARHELWREAAISGVASASGAWS